MKRIAWMGILVLFTQCTQDCLQAEARLKLVGFSPAERNTIILKSYQRGSGFTSWTDSVFVNGTSCNCIINNDTLELSPFINNQSGLRSAYDYEISVPAAGKTYRIDSITENNRRLNTGPFSKVACANDINTYQLNGNTVKSENGLLITIAR